MSKPIGRPPKLTLEQRMEARRLVRVERQKPKDQGSRVKAVMNELARKFNCSKSTIEKTVYG